jgi:hypothetical protein
MPGKIFQYIHPNWSSEGLTGFSMDPLSRMVFSVTNEEHLELAETFDPEMTKQQGVDVLCLPYTLTPFALPEAARSLSFQDGAIGDVRFDPPSVKSEMVSNMCVFPRDMLAGLTVQWAAGCLPLAYPCLPFAVRKRDGQQRLSLYRRRRRLL